MLDLKLSGKLVFVTGSTAGIGKATAFKFAEQGAKVIIAGRSQDKVQKVIEEIKTKFGVSKIYGVVSDLSTEQGVEQAIHQVEKLSLGAVDILINNFGVYERKLFSELGYKDLVKLFETNVASSFRITQAFLPAMLERNQGSVVFVSSEAGYCPKDFMIHYSITKTAQFSLARGIAELTKGTKVRVNVVSPGPTMTEGVSGYLKQYAAEKNFDSLEEAEATYIKSVEPTSLIQRFALPEEVADVILFQSSELASAVNGTNWLAEGGIVRHV